MDDFMQSNSCATTADEVAFDHKTTRAPTAEAAAGARDRIVWDRLSDQPHQHAGRWEKTLIRLADAPSHVRDLAVAQIEPNPDQPRRRFDDAGLEALVSLESGLFADFYKYVWPLYSAEGGASWSTGTTIPGSTRCASSCLARRP